MLILGFGNKARNGKDTSARAIRDYYDAQNAARLAHLATYKGTVRTGIFSFGAALYQEVNEAIQFYGSAQELVEYIHRDTTGFVDDNDWVQVEPNPEISALAPFGKHPKILQYWGTEYRRKRYGADYWVKKLFANIPDNLDIAMITDVRFQNEADGIKERGGYTVNVQRLREDGTQFYSSDRPAGHPSETQLDNYNWDFFIKTKDGNAALVGEQAITLATYLRGLRK